MCCCCAGTSVGCGDVAICNSWHCMECQFEDVLTCGLMITHYRTHAKKVGQRQSPVWEWEYSTVLG